MRTHAMERNALVAGAVAMGLVVLVSNVTVGYPINDWLTWGAFAYPLTFLVTDLTNRILGAGPARRQGHRYCAGKHQQAKDHREAVVTRSAVEPPAVGRPA